MILTTIQTIIYSKLCTDSKKALRRNRKYRRPYYPRVSIVNRLSIELGLTKEQITSELIEMSKKISSDP